MITGHDIIYISSIEWSFLWQIHQEIAIRLARAGNRVLYIENTGVRAPGVRDVRRVTARLKRWASASTSHGVREVVPNVFVCSPLVLPPFGGRLRRAVNKRILLPKVKNVARSLGFKNDILWTYLPTDTAVDLIDILREPTSRTIYYCVADFSKLTPHPAMLLRSEEELVRLSDLVLAQCKSLAVHCERWTAKTHVFPAGVDLESFPRSLMFRRRADMNNGASPSANPMDLGPALEHKAGNGGLMIGYVGGIHRFMDQELVAGMARLKPEWSFVLIGPEQVSTAVLKELENVFMLGAKPHKELAAYLQHFDACLIPYKITDETAAIVPVKLNEYLAAGKPVISTPLPTIIEFDEQYGVLTLSDPEALAFVNQTEKAIRCDSDVEIHRRRNIAELSSYEVRLEEISSLICEAFEQDGQNESTVEVDVQEACLTKS
jgi:glycosyltransferase involved in cell wall biosynthesis